MKTFTSVGVIECRHSASSLWISATSPVYGWTLKKVFPKGPAHEISRRFPDVEIVNSAADIVNDSSIDLIILADPASRDLNLIATALEAGKNIRIL
ncbi:MAG: hypothetical protein DI535_06985 [Citrobacter freundii]|nr:MAG: hypothetical protein DI535_06985 [Citrobacter freundii]